MTRIVLLLLALVSLAAQAGPAFNNVTVGDTITVNQNGYAVQYPVQTLMGSSGAVVKQGFLDNSTAAATTSFTKQTVLAATATIPIPLTGGTYNFASAGTGVQFAVLTSGGAISSVLTVAVAGSGYSVGDCLVMVGGNGDAILRVTAVSSGAVSTASVLYGGTGYVGSLQLTGAPLPPGSRTGALTGTLTSNATIIIPAGTLLQGARRIGFANGTTGAFTVTVKLSNGAGGSTGTGVVLPQGTGNAASMLIYTDGVNDVWPEVNAFPGGVTCSGSPTASFATVLGVVTHC